MDTLIIDDNTIAREILCQLAERIPYINIVGECDNALDAYSYIHKFNVDLLLLDIEMPQMTGLELTRDLGNKGPIIIFTTAKKEYAAAAFDLNVADYLVKPVLPARFVQSVKKAKDIYDSRRNEVQLQEDSFIFIREGTVVHRLDLDDILYAEAMGDYVKIHVPGKLHVVHTKFKNVEEKLPSSRFLRIHRSYIVAVDKIDSLQEGIIIIKGTLLPVAEGYRKALNERLRVL